MSSKRFAVIMFGVFFTLFFVLPFAWPGFTQGDQVDIIVPLVFGAAIVLPIVPFSRSNTRAKRAQLSTLATRFALAEVPRQSRSWFAPWTEAIETNDKVEGRYRGFHTTITTVCVSGGKRSVDYSLVVLRLPTATGRRFRVGRKGNRIGIADFDVWCEHPTGSAEFDSHFTVGHARQSRATRSLDDGFQRILLEQQDAVGGAIVLRDDRLFYIERDELIADDVRLRLEMAVELLCDLASELDDPYALPKAA
ncbi:MAG: hypothetical protein AAGA11_13760 [Pseudomonadota bacterium]